ncbi:MAG TPA: ABC transporter permease [Solirubrobacteraceae bacterium]|nr:ABC transporter permease [Solirubrobacteraceae bacterium]
MRWLLIKDLQILRRSPLMVALLVIWPIAIALMIGFALSSPPGKPKVAFYDAVPAGKGKLHFGNQQINISAYAKDLFQSIQPIFVHSQAEAVAKVRDGEALAALIVPGDITQQIQSLVTTGVGSPTVQLILNSKDPLERQFVNQAISTRLAEVEQDVSKQVLRVAVADLQQVLNGGSINFLGQDFHLLGLRASRTIVQGAIASQPRGSPIAAALRQVAGFASLAIEGLGFASPVLGTIGTPLTVDQTQLAGKTTPTDTYAVAIAVIVSLMFVTLLLAAGMLAIERSEHAYSRLVRGLVSPTGLLSEKVVLASGCAAALALVMAACVSLFVHLDWSRFELWLVAVAFGAVAFGALGVAIGGFAREISAASLLAFLVALPIAFVALIPADAVSGGLKTVLDVVAFVFPFKPALEAVSNAFSGASPGLGLPLLHLIGLTVAFAVLARIALRRFAA